MYSDIADVYNEIFPLNHSFLKFIPDYLGKPGSKVLDLGCGPGDYVNELSSEYDVTGIDLNPEMIKLAKARNKGTFYQMSFTQIIELEGGFGCIYSIGNSLSYLAGNDTASFLKTVNNLLVPSGHFILQVVNWDKYRLTQTMDFDVKKLSDGRTFHRRYEFLGDGGVLFKTELRENEEVKGAWSDPLYPKYMENLISGISASGLVPVEQFGDFEKGPFIHEASPATIVVAKNPDAD